jgi:hypothetical protein
MWVFTKHSFISIDTSENSPGYFLVQSRFPHHIENLFPEAQVTKKPYGAYRFRTIIPRHVVSQKLHDLAEGIDYQDLKDSIPDPLYQTACRDVLATLKKYKPGSGTPPK